MVENVVQNIDIYPTLMELTGTKLNDNIKLHGNSLVPLLHNKTADWEDIAYTSAKGSYGVVTDRYRFTKSEEGQYQLYDLQEDPDEWINLAKDANYKKMIKSFENKMGKVVWNKPQ
ncbi:MAG: DUF4976 domain-containing protein [Gammaproteobacteria bacterium]|nr:DUF4976 domain-containing protein [Gammaproteobacteria bacterium]